MALTLFLGMLTTAQSVLLGMLTLRIGGFIAASAVCSLAVHAALHLVARATGAAREMATSPVIRPLRDPLMLYPPLAAAGVQAALTLALARGLFGAPAVAKWGADEGLRFALAIWSATSAHGIWLDLCVFRISWRIFLQFQLGSFATACVIGACLGAML